MVTRAALIEAFVDAVEPLPCFRALWLGGSDATGRADALSDVDFCIICARGELEPCIQQVRQAIEAISPIAIDYRLPSPTWHGFEQAFYQLADAPEHLMVDWIVIEAGTAHPWFEVERHGRAVVLFDKDGVIAPTHADLAALRAAAARKVQELRLKFPMFRHMPGKLAARGLPVDAAHFYHAMLRTLVDVLRCVHCPDRHDYSLRYLRDDLPPEVYSQLEPLLYPAAPSVLADNMRRASLLFQAALAAWDAAAEKPGSAATGVASGNQRGE